MKEFGIATLVASLTFVFLMTAASVARLYGYAEGYEVRINGVLFSAAKVDLLSLKVIAYSRFGNGYEDVSVRKASGSQNTYSYKDSKLVNVRIGNDFIDHSVELAKYEKEAEKLLQEMRKRFSDVMPPQ